MPKLTKNGAIRKILKVVLAGLEAPGYGLKLRKTPGGSSWVFVTRSTDSGPNAPSVRIHVAYPASRRRWTPSTPGAVYVNSARFPQRGDGTFNVKGIAERVRKEFLAIDEVRAMAERGRRDADKAAELQEHLEQLAPASCPVRVAYNSELDVTLSLGPVPAAKAEQILHWLSRMPDVVFLRGQVWRHKTQGFESEITEVKGDGYVVLHSGQGPDLLLLQRELVERWDLVRNPATTEDA